MTEGHTMKAIRGTFRDGEIVPDVPPNWPDGTRVEIEPIPEIPASLLTDEEQGDDDAGHDNSPLLR